MTTNPPTPGDELVERLREALEPFDDFAKNNVGEDGWEGLGCQRERIVDWFGPTDFRRAMQAATLLESLRTRDEAARSATSEEVEAETYRQMHEIAVELGYPSILEALEATPPALQAKDHSNAQAQ